ncbi:hypothetical protein GQR58_009408 [Nymphon striatum]|nr:hypothetical protein GQR58_009408 [Nymphon striatum]
MTIKLYVVVLYPYFNQSKACNMSRKFICGHTFQVYNEMIDHLEEIVPQYMEELRGISQGASTPFHKLFLANVDEDYSGIMKYAGQKESSSLDSVSKGCSTILINKPNQRLICHNEDGHIDKFGRCYMVDATLYRNNKKENIIEERFIAYCYPGYLAGSVLGFNHHGIFISTNYINTLKASKLHLRFGPSIVCSTVQVYGPVPLATLAMSPIILHPIARQKVCDVTNLNVAWCEKAQTEDKLSVKNIEVGPTDVDNPVFDIKDLEVDEIYFHTNRFHRLNIDQGNARMASESSECREETWNSFKPEKQANYIEVLSDESHENYTIFRSDPAKSCTYCTSM